MGAPYTSKSTPATYNANPPPDDGTPSDANRVKWATIKTKLADSLKTFVESVNAENLSAFAKVVGGGGVTSTAVNYTVQASDQGNLVVATAAVTITTPVAATVGQPFVFFVLNDHTAAITLDGNGSETINGDASVTLQPGDGAALFTDGTNWFAAGPLAAAQHHDTLTLDTKIDVTNGGANDLTEVDFTDIPAWVKRITVQFTAVSTDGTDLILLLLGDAGGFETTSYNGSLTRLANAAAVSSGNHSTAGGFNCTGGMAALNTVYGTLVLTLLDAATFTWALSGNLALGNSAVNMISAGSKPLSAALTQIRITTFGGTDTFDGGSINILYE